MSEELARHSLLFVVPTERGPRCRMLDTIRTYVAERRASRPDVAEIDRRHAEYFRTMAEAADRPLRGFDADHWAARLEDGSGNLTAALRWYFANDRTPLPHLFRVLWLFWILRDHLGEARPWVEQLVPAADSLEIQPRAELLLTAALASVEVVGD